MQGIQQDMATSPPEHSKDEIEEDLEEPEIKEEAPIADSVSSSGNFSAMFDGQPLSQEEQSLIKMLK